MDNTTSDPFWFCVWVPVLICVWACVRVCVPVMFPQLWPLKVWCDYQWEEEAVESGGQEGLLWHTGQQRSPVEGDSLMFVLSIASLMGPFCLTGPLSACVSTGQPIAPDACDSCDFAESMQWHVFVFDACFEWWTVSSTQQEGLFSHDED